jgi:hypothetical protein
MKDTRAIEKFYSVQEVALLLGFEAQWVRERVKDGSFLDPHFVPRWEGETDLSVVELGGETRIAASGINRVLAKHAKAGVNPIKARNMAELRRREAERKAQAGQVEGFGSGVEHAATARIFR